MNEGKDLLLDLNILARATQKYYDRQLLELDLTYAQLPVLLMIYESDGITANQIVGMGQYDKGTVTRNVQKLETLGYIETRNSLTDKRVRHLYPTDRAKAVISRIYAVRRDWWNHLVQKIPEAEIDSFVNQTRGMVESAVEASNTGSAPVIFYRRDNLSLNTWPGHLSMVLYASGCNFRCPGCPETKRIVLPEDAKTADADETIRMLKERKDFLDGIVIAGGEPFLQPGLPEFLSQLKQIGIPVRIETNGTSPLALRSCIERGLADSICLRLRNSPGKYPVSAGLSSFDPSVITRCMDILSGSEADWEVLLEVDEGYFDDDDMETIADWTERAPHFRIINHEKRGTGIDPNLGPMDSKRFAVWKERLER